MRTSYRRYDIIRNMSIIQNLLDIIKLMLIFNSLGIISRGKYGIK